jgi:leucyl aminopeptidase
MHISFTPTAPDSSSALIVPVPKDGLAGAVLQGLSEGAAQTVRAAAASARFEGEAGGAFEGFAESDGGVRRVLLVGTGLPVRRFRRACSLLAKRRPPLICPAW